MKIITILMMMMIQVLSLEIGEVGSIPLWILVLAILAGLLFLSLLTFILHRLGFFNRNRPEDFDYQVTLPVGRRLKSIIASQDCFK